MQPLQVPSNTPRASSEAIGSSGARRPGYFLREETSPTRSESGRSYISTSSRSVRRELSGGDDPALEPAPTHSPGHSPPFSSCQIAKWYWERTLPRKRPADIWPPRGSPVACHGPLAGRTRDARTPADSRGPGHDIGAPHCGDTPAGPPPRRRPWRCARSVPRPAARSCAPLTMCPLTALPRRA